TLYPVLAAALGLLVAIATWAPDHRGRHVHALSLPLPRWRYVLLRFGAGATLLAAPIVAVSAGALLATWSATIPAGLQGYPGALAIRFALAVLVAYAVFFAVSAGTARTAGFSVVPCRAHPSGWENPRYSQNRGMSLRVCASSQWCLPWSREGSRVRASSGCRRARTVCCASGAAPTPWRTWWTASIAPAPLGA